MMKKVWYLLFISQFGYSQIATNDPGMALLNAYSCDSLGNKSLDQLDAVKSLEKSVAAIHNDEECRFLADQISALPDIEGILDNLRQDGIVKSIIEQEAIINQAIADLQAIDAAEVNQDSSDSYLYPDPDILRSTIQSAKTQLTQLKAQLAADEIQAERESYINGISQLNNLGESIGDLLQNPSSDCLNRYPGVKTKMASGLVGISGFFMNQPLGIATNLAGKLIQSVLGISRASRRAKQNRKAFKGIQDVNLISGLSCGLESLAAQRCKLAREHNVYQRLVKINSSDQPSIDDKLKDAFGDQCFSRLFILPSQSERSLSSIVKWVQESNSMGIGAIGDNNTQARQEALSNFNSASSKYEVKISKLLLVIRDSQNEETKRQKISESLTRFFSEHMATGRSADYSLFASFHTSEVYSAAEKNQLFIRFINNSRTTDSDIQEQFDKLRTEYIAFKKESVRQRGGNAENLVVQDASDITMFNEMVYGIQIHTSNGLNSLQGEQTKKIASLLMDDSAVINSLQNLNILRNEVTNALSDGALEEQKDGLVMKFFGAQSTIVSPYQHLKNLKSYLEALPDIPKQRRAFLGIDGEKGLKKSIENVIKKADTLLENQMNSGEKEDWSGLIEDMNTLVGLNNNLGRKIANINQEVSNQLKNQLSKNVKTLTPQQKRDYNEALFLMNRDSLSNAIQITTPTDQNYDYINAKELNKEHLQGFGNFFNDYIEDSLKNSKNMDPLMKNKLCISLLALPDMNVSSPHAQACKGAKIESLTGKAQINFNDFIGKDFETRACAYSDFRTKEKFVLENK